MKLTLTKEADEDLREILGYSIAEFGLKRAEKYYFELQNKFNSILERASHSTDYSFVEEGLRRTNYMKHAIFYRSTDQEIIIIRVLHQKMDMLRHLKE